MQRTLPSYPLLVIDTASRRTWVGLKTGSDQLIFRSEDQDPSRSLFRLVEAVLDEAGISLEELAAIAFCEGPGSMLGARSASMAIRTWKGIGIPAAKSVFSYNSLQLGAYIAAEDPTLAEAGLVACDARQSSWIVLGFPYQQGSEPQLLSNAELEASAGQAVRFSEFPLWTKTTTEFAEISYAPEKAFCEDAFLGLLQKREDASPLVIRPAAFKRWEAKIHTAPES